MTSPRPRPNPILGIALAIPWLLLPPVIDAATGPSLHGYLEAQARGFPDTGLYPEQVQGDPSAAVRLEGRTEIAGIDLGLVPFFRYDGVDRERTHGDLREFDARFRAAGLDWQIGLGQVFWGVVESRHLVDIINQTDQVEDIDGDERLGQPMLHVGRTTDWGRFEVFALPGFRERTFPGPHGRLYLPIDTDHPVFESPEQGRHLDWAGRWSRSFGSWDLGLGAFSGTRRDPRMGPEVRNGRMIIYYDLIDQVSLDLQGSVGDWVFKLESFWRETPFDDYAALVGGFEYTSYGIADSDADLGLLAEYLYDGRENTLETPFQNDLFLGLRLALNDARDSTALGGVFFDMQTNSLFWRLEASRRLAEHWTLGLDLTGFPRTEPGETIWYWRRDGYAQLELRRWF